MTTIVDLSILLEECNNLVYPGTVYLKIRPVIDYDRNMLLSSNAELWLHAGTHVDAPNHVINGAPSIENAQLDKLVHEAVILDLTQRVKENYPIAPRDLQEAELELQANDEKIRTGDILILRTDWSQSRLPWTAEYRNNSPHLTSGSADWLIAKKPSAVGFDFPEEKITNLFAVRVETDAGESINHPLPIHRSLLGSGIYLVEHLTNLDKFNTRKRFLFVAAPLKIKGAEGTPVRAFGILPSS